MSRSCSGTPRAGAAVSSAPLRARRLSATLDDGRALFADLELALPPGPTALVGANGSGKSTLLRAITGGGALAHGEVVAHVSVQSLNQHLDALPADTSALDWLRMRMQELDPSEISTRLALLGLPGTRVQQTLGTLSGGERMRVAVVAAAWSQPVAPLLLLDEPASHLDFDSVEALVALLRAWPGALLVVSHDPALLESLHITHHLHLDADSLTLS